MSKSNLLKQLQNVLIGEQQKHADEQASAHMGTVQPHTLKAKNTGAKAAWCSTQQNKKRTMDVQMGQALWSKL
jgi:hypothetical protein